MRVPVSDPDPYVMNHTPGKQPPFPAWMKRTVQLLGGESVYRLQRAHVLVAGLGGVGSMAAEMLVRSGVGTITIADSDRVQPSNINRQVPALHSTLDQPKAAVMAGRLKAINPELSLHSHETFLDESSIGSLLEEHAVDYVVDAIDTLTPKIRLIVEAVTRNIPLASSMGSAGKTDPSAIRIADLEKSYHCRLAYILRKKLRKFGVHGGFRVVFSTEPVDKSLVIPVEDEPNKKSTLGTVPWIPAIFGSMLAAVAVEELTGVDMPR